jgi:hypothetical protein
MISDDAHPTFGIALTTWIVQMGAARTRLELAH